MFQSVKGETTNRNKTTNHRHHLPLKGAGRSKELTRSKVPLTTGTRGGRQGDRKRRRNVRAHEMQIFWWRRKDGSERWHYTRALCFWTQSCYVGLAGRSSPLHFQSNGTASYEAIACGMFSREQQRGHFNHPSRRHLLFPASPLDTILGMKAGQFFFSDNINSSHIY